MVDDIQFHKPLPPVSNTKRVKRAGRQDKEKHDSSFKKYLKQNEDNEEENLDDKKQKKQTQAMNPPKEIANKDAQAQQSAEKPNTHQERSVRKRIDVRA